jgi:hypothetical protein
MSDWRHHAACREQDPALFFPDGNSSPALVQIGVAKAVCRRCPVIDLCLQWALEAGQEFGVWGGLSEGERRAMRRRAAQPAIDFGDIDAEINAPKAPRKGRTLQAVWADRTVPFHGGLHLAWTGGPSISYAGRSHTARQVAFIVDRGRRPDGPVQRLCEAEGCVLPRHLADGPELQEKAAQLVAEAGAG